MILCYENLLFGATISVGNSSGNETSNLKQGVSEKLISTKELSVYCLHNYCMSFNGKCSFAASIRWAVR